MELILYKIAVALCFIAQSYSQPQPYIPRDSTIFPEQGCSREKGYSYDDPNACGEPWYCRNYISRIESSNICQNYYNNYSFYSSIYGQNLDALYIIYKDDGNINEKTVPQFDNSDNRHLIYSLNLEDNDYAFVPRLEKMENLVILKLSRNVLTTAKLSNDNELPALTYLDYSHNNIINIEVDPGEFEFKTLKTLNISHNYLATIPEAIFDSFANLETLDLSHNYIYALDILSFEGIRKLTILDLSYNRISDINSALLRFSELTVLDLSHNIIDTLKAKDFKKLGHLKFLYVNSNSIKYVEKNVFDDMASLMDIDLQDNVIEIIDQEIFNNATQLSTVRLARNKLKSLPKYAFKGKHITSFSIEGNELQGSLERGWFEGLSMVTELNLSGQRLNSIENYAFTGLVPLKTLLLNNNNLYSLSNHSFKGLPNLKDLDLSHNDIANFDIMTDELLSLEKLSLRHNKLTKISSYSFKGLSTLQFLDLSHNNIAHLESNSFKSLERLLSFKISDNPLTGAIEERTFDGLNLLPSLDISSSLITQLNNGSFMGMTILDKLNVSHSNITVLQFNSLSYLGNIQSIDLSYNQLSIFDVNTTDLTNLRTILLNNNLLQVISHTLFNGMSVLSKIVLSHNRIDTLNKETFYGVGDLRYLDLSYNKDLEFDPSFVDKARNLDKLFISGTKTDVTFEEIADIPITELEIAHSNIQNITQLNFKRLHHLETLIMSNNAVSKLEVGALSNLTALKKLDLSFNNLSSIQPGAFMDNTYLLSLNISHNHLVEINYGIFRGLIYLKTIDLSYNYIKSLHNGRLYEVENLERLIADYNKIESISPDEFSGTNLATLSIGGNPLPCEILVNLKKGYSDFIITAIISDETNENVGGVTCNKDSYDVHSKPISSPNERDNLLIDIRNILYNISRERIVKEEVAVTHDTHYLANVSEQQQKLNQNVMDSVEKLSSVSNLTSTLINVNSNTNLILGKILKILSAKDSILPPTPTVKPITIVKGNENATSENLIPYINKIKQALEETIAVEKQNILIDIDSKIEKLNSRIDSSILTTKMPVHDKLVDASESTQRAPVFTEICMGLILVILVGFVLVKLYQSKIHLSSNRSYNCSTRHIADAMENSNL